MFADSADDSFLGELATFIALSCVDVAMLTVNSKRRGAVFVLILVLILTVWIYLSFNVGSASDYKSPSAFNVESNSPVHELDSPAFSQAPLCSQNCLAYKDRLHRYCHTSLLNGSDHLSSSEGALADDRFKLVHLHIVARHGDRTPVSKLNLGPKVYHECGLPADGEFNWNGLDDFPPPTSLDPGQTDPHIPLNPGTEPRECRDTKGYGMLTALGYKQLAKLGKLMSEQYKVFLSSILNRNLYPLTTGVFLQSTEIPRTTQSLAAFMLGFLPDSQKLRQAAHIHVSRGTRLESTPPYDIETQYDHCHDYYNLWDEDRRQTGYLAKEDKRRYLIDNLCRMFGLSRKCRHLSVSKVFEQLSIRGCHQPSDILPCIRNDGPCVKHAQALELFKYIDWAWSNGHPLKSSIIGTTSFLQNSVLTPMQGVIEHINGDEWRNVGYDETPADINKAMVSLTHDDTITKLLVNLGIPVKEWMPYASRVVFELWQKKHSDKDFMVRILFNGKPVTRDCGAWKMA